LTDVTIEVKTFANLQVDYPSVPSFVIEKGDTVLSVMKRLGIPPEKVTIIFINNKHAEESTPLKGGDVLGLFPPIGGG
jgi:molybdopterin synthase sulfur carrier subunit